MKSYQAHLSSTNIKNPKISGNNEVLRSSAIFPFIINDSLDTKILFMGYWLIKRNIKKVSLNISIRSKEGILIKKSVQTINQVKAFSISLKKILKFKSGTKFKSGSIELEILSDKNMVYPYPALVVNYQGKDSSAVVHTCGRIYNNRRDFLENNQQKVLETGIDILPNKDFIPFFSFVNGKSKIKKTELNIKVINYLGEEFTKIIILKDLKPYETKFVYFLNDNEKKFLREKKATVKIKHNFTNFFPRFLSGNIQQNFFNSSLTHTYYDTSKQKDKNAFWPNPNKNIFYDSSVSFPLFKNKKSYTELVVYPNFPKCNVKFNLEIYNNTGIKIKKLNSVLKISNKLNKPIYLDIKKILNKDNIKINYKKDHLIKLIVDGNGKVPTRLKFGLNLGFKNKFDVPSNICFNAHVPNSKVLTKPGTFKWAPILNKHNSYFIISNTSNLKNKNKKANVVLNFWNELDNKFLRKKMLIKNNGSYWFDLNKNKKIQKFLKNKTGWVTIQSDNPFVNGWYVEKSNAGFIGADHFF